MNNATHFEDRSHLDAFSTNCVSVYILDDKTCRVVTNAHWTDEPKVVRPQSVVFANVSEARSALKSAGFVKDPNYCEWVRP